MGEVTRKIHFYRTSFWRLDPTQNRLVEFADVFPTFRYIKELPADYSQEPNRYLSLSDGNELFMHIDSIAGDVRGRFAAKRKTKLPVIEGQGNYNRLALSDGEGLAEVFHFIYFPQTKMMGVEFNFYAPRLAKWQEYLTYKAQNLVNKVDQQILLSDDVSRTLQRLGRKTVAEIGVHRDRIDVLRELDASLDQSFEALHNMTNAMELQVVLRLKSRKQEDALVLTWLDRIADFLRVSRNREALSKLKVHGYDGAMGKTVPVDLLEDSMVAVRKVTTLDDVSKAVKTEAMYANIEDAHKQLIEQRGIRVTA